MNVTRLSSLSAAECVGTVQEPGPAAAPARLPNSDALQHAFGQRFHHQPRSYGDHRIQAQAALKLVWIKRGNKKQNKNKTPLDSLDQVRRPCWATDWQQGRVSPSCQAEPQTVQLGDEGSIVTGLTAQQGADDSCYCGRLRAVKACVKLQQLLAKLGPVRRSRESVCLRTPNYIFFCFVRTLNFFFLSPLHFGLGTTECKYPHWPEKVRVERGGGWDLFHMGVQSTKLYMGFSHFSYTSSEEDSHHGKFYFFLRVDTALTAVPVFFFFVVFFPPLNSRQTWMHPRECVVSFLLQLVARPLPPHPKSPRDLSSNGKSVSLLCTCR